jgi:hypothetical protein
MVILKTQSQVNIKGTDGVNFWGVKYNIFYDNDKVLLTIYSHCSGTIPVSYYEILAITKIRTQ